MVKICMNCGNQCKEEVSFCPYCGARFSTVNDLQKNDISNQGMNSDMFMQNTISPQNTSLHQNEEDELKNQSHDQCQIASLQMDIASTIAVTGVEVRDVTVELSELGELVNDDKADQFINEFLILGGIESVNDYSEWLSLKSELALDEDGADGRVFVSADSATGQVCVFMTENGDPDGEKIEKLTTES